MILCNSNIFGSKSGSKTNRKRYNFPKSCGIGFALYGIDAAASLYCVFPLESSAMCNKKAVLCTASFVISVHCFVQARQCTATTKATHKSGFLVAHCARDSGGIRTHDPQLRRLLLYPTELRNHQQRLCGICDAKINHLFLLSKINRKLHDLLCIYHRFNDVVGPIHAPYPQSYNPSAPSAQAGDKSYPKPHR